MNMEPETLSEVKAFVFDVFGTVVDWRGSVAKQLSQSHGLPPDVSSGQRFMFH